jgi:hypothetical protein
MLYRPDKESLYLDHGNIAEFGRRTSKEFLIFIYLTWLRTAKSFIYCFRSKMGGNEEFSDLYKTRIYTKTDQFIKYLRNILKLNKLNEHNESNKLNNLTN